MVIIGVQRRVVIIIRIDIEPVIIMIIIDDQWPVPARDVLRFSRSLSKVAKRRLRIYKPQIIAAPR